MKVYIWVNGKLKNAEHHLDGVPEMITGKCTLFLLNNYRGKRYINNNRLVYEYDLTNELRDLIVDTKPINHLAL